MLATINDDTWNMLNMQHITPNSKRWDYSDIPGDGHKKLKDPPAHMAEGVHHLRKAPTPHPLGFNAAWPKVNQARGRRPKMSWPTKFDLNQINSLFANAKKLFEKNRSQDMMGI